MNTLGFGESDRNMGKAEIFENIPAAFPLNVRTSGTTERKHGKNSPAQNHCSTVQNNCEVLKKKF